MRSIEVKAAVIMTLLFMILMRLVWMDTRSYVIVYAPENHRSVYDGGICRQESWHVQSSPKTTQRPGWGNSLLYQAMLSESCRNGVFSEGSFVRYNQGLLLLSIISCMILARITTRSWIIALVVGLALMSRGRLIASSGQISGDHLIMFGVTLWAVFIGHWIRSGSRIILGAIFFSLVWLIDLELSFLPLILVPLIYAVTVRTEHAKQRRVIKDTILFWPSLQRFLELENFHNATEEEPTGGIFRPLPQTFSKPLRDGEVYQGFLRDYSILTMGVVLITLILAIFKSQWGLSLDWHMARLQLWGQLFLMPFDRDVMLSLLAIVSALAIHTFVLPALRGLNYSIALGILLSALGVLIVDHIYLPVEATGFWMASQVMLWWEPLILGLGVLGFYHCLITLTNRLWKRFRSKNAKAE
ncbi:MAG: hypothetical protein EOP10_19240 [Proteobacteria bacterium]|nr:MAG: hypothetical protein EOP10_19240 [Pseudomonadota bacterium]